MKKIIKIGKAVLVLVLLGLIGVIGWFVFGQFYLFSVGRPCGGDYFNALTYAKFFKDNLTWPPLGWLPFWHEGMPQIGGYSWLPYLLMHPLHWFFSIEWALEIFSAATLILFLMISFLLFLEVADDLLVAFGLALVLIFTRGVYYPLLAGAFFVSSTMQFLLPLTLLTMLHFLKGKGSRWLILSSALAGLALLWHGAIGLLCVFMPCFLVFLFWPKLKSKKWGGLFFFTVLASLVGSLGLYSLIIQVFFGQGQDRCQSIECWGAYPRHFKWFNPLEGSLLLGGLVLLIGFWLVKRKVSWSKVMALAGGLSVLVLYAVFAKLKLIDSLVNVVFPTRIFWAAAVLILALVAEVWRQLRRQMGQLKWLGSMALTALLVISAFLWFRNGELETTLICDVSSVFPLNIDEWITEKYGKKDWQEKIPEWLPVKEANFRLDSSAFQFSHWFSYLADLPDTKGYSNHPLGKHRDWLYWLQVAMKEENGTVVKNTAKFLLDAFGVGFLQGREYASSLLADQELIIRQEEKGGFYYSQVNPQLTSPIISGSQAPRLLFIGDEAAYDSLIRSLAMEGINSRRLMVIKGGEKVNSLKWEEIKPFETVFLYGYQSKKAARGWSVLARYVEEGGRLWIETGDHVLESDSQTGGYQQLPSVFPVAETESEALGKSWQGKIESEEMKNISPKKFSPLEESGQEWTLSTATATRDWAQSLLKQQDKVIVAQGKLGEGTVIWSGLNLPYHLVLSSNQEELKFFKTLLEEIAPLSDGNLPEFQSTRVLPRKIIVQGKNIKGVFFKENFNRGWKARTKEGKSLEIYPAGLDFMYVILPEEGEFNLELDYRGTLISWVLFILTLLASILVGGALFFPKMFGQAKKNIFGGWGERIRKQWEEEE